MLQKTVRLFLVASLFAFLLPAYTFASEERLFAQTPTQDEMDQALEEAQQAAEEFEAEMNETIEETEEDYEIQIMEGTESLETFNEAMDNMVEAQEEMNEKTIAGFVVGSSIFILFTLFIGLLAFAGLVFNIIMIIDCIKRDFKDRTLWLVLLIVGTLMGWGLLPGILYFFLVKKKLGPVQKTEGVKETTEVQE